MLLSTPMVLYQSLGYGLWAYGLIFMGLGILILAIGYNCIESLNKGKIPPILRWEGLS